MFQNPADGFCAERAPGTIGAARRRRNCRLRAFLKHERMTVAMNLATIQHHSYMKSAVVDVGVQVGSPLAPVIESYPSSGLVGPQFSLTVDETSHVAPAVPLFRMARGHYVEQSLPAPGCAPQLGDDMGLQRGDTEFIEMLVMSSCFALRLPEPGGASRLNHATGSSCPAFGGAPRLAGEALRGGDSDVRGVRPRMADHGADVHSQVQQRAAVQGKDVRMEQVFVQAFPAGQDDPMKFKLGCPGWRECSSVLSVVWRAGGPSNVAQTSCCMGFVSTGTTVLLLTRQPNSTHVHHRRSTWWWRRSNVVGDAAAHRCPERDFNTGLPVAIEGFVLISSGNLAEIRWLGPKLGIPWTLLGCPCRSPGQIKYTGGTGSGAWHPLTPSWVPP